MAEQNNRSLWVDAARGLAIILVVIGHSPNEKLSHYIYWFHIPAFFALSGFLFRPVPDWSCFRHWAWKRTLQLLVPYISFFALITTVRYYLEPHNVEILAELFHLAAGGLLLKGFYTTFWFITCLYATQILFAVIILKFKTVTGQLSVISILYLLAHLEVWVKQAHGFFVPWSLDVSLIALTYYAFGYFARPLLNKIPTAVFIVSLFFSLSLIIGSELEILSYRLDLKPQVYIHPTLDLVIPIIMTISLFGLIQACTETKFTRILATLGTSSLTIMYLHVPVNNFITRSTADYGYITYTILGVLIPWFASRYIFEQNPATKFLFLGSFKHPGLTRTLLSYPGKLKYYFRQ